MKLKPDLQLSVATAQAIVDETASGKAVATISRLHGGEIATVYEIAFVDEAYPPLVLKVSQRQPLVPVCAPVPAIRDPAMG